MTHHDSNSFFTDIPAFGSFSGITEDINFRSVPPDWHVIITDIKGSTAAIEDGRYRDVNTIGVATIVATQNALEQTPFPYVFGGDGATMIVPPGAMERASQALADLRQLAEENFQLDLRVGTLRVAELLSDNVTLEVARFSLVGQQSVTIFRGGGLSLAEEKIKGDDERYAIKDHRDGSADFEGLSCRWRPIPSKRGSILAILVSARGDDPSPIYDEILGKLDEILDGDMENANPVNMSGLRLRTAADAHSAEKRLHHSWLSIRYWIRFVEIFVGALIYRLHLPTPGFRRSHYVPSIRAHSDYRKFDDMLRMVLDCSAAQAEEIDTYLESLHQQGKVFYGIHNSSEALITCYFQDFADGGHIHFIDGGDGGYAMAAKHLKTQMASS